MNNTKHLGKGSTIPTLPNDGKLILYSMKYCPYAQRAHLVLDAKQIPYHTVFINLTEKPEWLVEKSPLLKVPALEIPGEKEPIIESLIICDYLDERYPDVKLHPRDELQKARDRTLVERLNSVTTPFYTLVLGGSGDVDTQIQNFTAGLKIYEAELVRRGTKYFGGSQIGMLDYMIWPFLERTEIISLMYEGKFDLTQVAPKIAEWREALKAEPVVQKTYIRGQEHLQFIEYRKSGSPKYDF